MSHLVTFPFYTPSLPLIIFSSAYAVSGETLMPSWLSREKNQHCLFLVLVCCVAFLFYNSMLGNMFNRVCSCSCADVGKDPKPLLTRDASCAAVGGSARKSFGMVQWVKIKLSPKQEMSSLWRHLFFLTFQSATFSFRALLYIL